MNNFTESLPKSGHVNEVCKEWLVREDGALAYKLQSQEISDFYKGNRFRNAVVREDFPTALHEQIKEHEQAEQQAEVQRRRLIEQEEDDKRIAKEIAEKLQLDLQEDQNRDFIESEMMAKRMQDIYVNLLPVPPPVSRVDKHKPPPRPAKASTLQQNNVNESSISTAHNARYRGNHLPSHDQAHPQTILLQQQHFIQKNTKPQQRTKPHKLLSNQFTERSKNACSATAQANDISPSHLQLSNFHQHEHTSSIASAGSASSSSSSSARPNDFFNNATSFSPQHSPLFSNAPSKAHALPVNMSKQSQVNEFTDYSDVADSIHRYNNNHSADVIDSSPKYRACSNFNKLLSTSNENLLKTDVTFQKLSLEKYDEIVGNASGGASCSKVHNRLQQADDDIELYADPCNYEDLQQIGLPMEEIKEMSKKLKQEQKDELLARRLQDLESYDGLNQEERDRLLAIEAQDKELAKMLQEREKSKAKRAKEKARLRKSQQQQKDCSSVSSMHCGPLLPLPQNCIFPSKQLSNSSNSGVTQTQSHSATLEESADLEAYSNPIDALHRTKMNILANDSLSSQATSNSDRHNNCPTRDDEIYTLPVDSCCLDPRPASLHLASYENPSTTRNNSMTRSENFSHDLQNTLSPNDISQRMNYSKSSSFEYSSSSTPPYMPIQGTRRTNSSDERKKKSRDKCTHQ